MIVFLAKRFECFQKNPSESLIECDVDNEVDRRITRDKRVADSTEVKLKTTAHSRSFWKNGPKYLCNKSWQLTYDEDHNNHDEDQSDVVVMALSSRL